MRDLLPQVRGEGAGHIASQKANGWVCLPEHYDDGGFSGGNLNRPALRKLLLDCEAGKVDVIVVYKIDRLSRSLCDFADLSRSFEKWNVAFVSVTQEINTQTSAGRMMLNILMTFAQFEREMIATRVKDKMAATRKKGKWIGGNVPFGYVAFEKRLYVDAEKAPVVRRIFNRYLEIQSPKQIAYELNQDGIKTVVGKEWCRQSIYNVLNNYTYVGKVFYEGHVYPGEQEAIIDDETWKLTQAMLKANGIERAYPMRPLQRRNDRSQFQTLGPRVPLLPVFEGQATRRVDLPGQGDSCRRHRDSGVRTPDAHNQSTGGRRRRVEVVRGAPKSRPEHVRGRILG